MRRASRRYGAENALAPGISTRACSLRPLRAVMPGRRERMLQRPRRRDRIVERAVAPQVSSEAPCGNDSGRSHVENALSWRRIARRGHRHNRCGAECPFLAPPVKPAASLSTPRVARSAQCGLLGLAGASPFRLRRARNRALGSRPPRRRPAADRTSCDREFPTRRARD